MRFGTWNVRIQYRASSLTAEARKLARYKLDLVGVQKVTWDKGGRVIFPMEKETEIVNWEQEILYITE
jgi:hypothetical protein